VNSLLELVPGQFEWQGVWDDSNLQAKECAEVSVPLRSENLHAGDDIAKIFTPAWF
jgi:hypothetical protein